MNPDLRALGRRLGLPASAPEALIWACLSAARGGGAASPAVAPVLSDVTLSAALGSVGAPLTAAPVYSTAGTAPVVATYQWTRGGVDISGATSSAYTLVGADEGAVIRCRCSATGPGGSTGPVTSSGLCQVRVYGLGRAAIGDDHLTTVGNVANQAGMTVLFFGSLSALGATRSCLVSWGADASGLDQGCILQINPTGSDTLDFVVSRAGTTASVTASVPIAGGNAADGTPRLLWGTISADGLTAQAGTGGTAGTGATITGGVDTGSSGIARVFARSLGTSFGTAGQGIVAVLPRAWASTEPGAIMALGTAALQRAAVLDLLTAEPSLLWWTAPVETETDGSTITAASETEDLAGVRTHALSTGAARLTAEGP